jgi:hypothetical protein
MGRAGFDYFPGAAGATRRGDPRSLETEPYAADEWVMT